MVRCRDGGRELNDEALMIPRAVCRLACCSGACSRPGPPITRVARVGKLLLALLCRM